MYAARTNRLATTPAPSIVRAVVSSPGRALDSTTRAYMEPRFVRSPGETASAGTNASVPSRLGVTDSGHASERSAHHRSLVAPCLSEISEIEEAD